MTNRFPTMRLRRLRSSQVMRDLLQEHTVSVNDLSSLDAAVNELG